MACVATLCEMTSPTCHCDERSEEAISSFYGGGCFVTPFLAATGIMSPVGDQAASASAETQDRLKGSVLSPSTGLGVLFTKGSP